MQIEQIDRDAAAKALGYATWEDATDYRNSGAEDRRVAHMVQAFAAHRLAALSARPAVGEDVVERVARAISDYTFATIHGSTDCNEWEDMTATDRFVYRNAAHAAIAAMGSDMGKGGEG